MSIQFYHILHLFAVMALFAGTGAALAGTGNPAARKFSASLRGAALLLLLVSGFGLLAKLGMMKNIPVATWIKTLIWVIAAVLPVFVKRKMLSPYAAVLLALVLGGIAAWLG